MMTKGLLADFNTVMASDTAPWSAKHMGGGGQQWTNLQEENMKLNVEMLCLASDNRQEQDDKPDFASVHFGIHHIPCNVHITSAWTPIYACTNSLCKAKKIVMYRYYSVPQHIRNSGLAYSPITYSQTFWGGTYFVLFVEKLSYLLFLISSAILCASSWHLSAQNYGEVS